MANLEDYAWRILPSLPACPDPVAIQYLRLAAIEFCRRSSALESTVETVSLTSGDFPYTVDSGDSDVIVNKVLAVSVNGADLVHGSLQDAKNFGGDNWKTKTGVPELYLERPYGVITLIPLPSVAMQVEITASLVPSANALTIPDSIMDVWQDTITSGAISMLAAIPNKPWTNPELHAYHREIFYSGVDEAKGEFHANHIRPTMSIATSPL